MGKRIRLLLVEDSDSDAELILHRLNKEGLEVEHERVQTAEAMRKSLAEAEWDMVLSDYSMPQFDAIEAWEILKASGIDIPFIIVSGKIGEETAVEAMRLGVQDYIMKDKLGRLVPAVIREVTDAGIRRAHRRDEEEKRRLEARYRMLFENASEGIAVVKDGNFLLVNPVLMKVLGKREGEVIGRPFEEFVHDDDRRKVVGFYRHRIQGQKAPDMYEFRINDGAGRIRWIENRAVLIDWEEGKATLNFLTDISERKAYQEQLEIDRAALENKNVALREVLSQIGAEKDAIKNRMLVNIRRSVLTNLSRLKDRVPPELVKNIELIEKDLNDIASPFMDKFSDDFRNLTARELEICRLIKDGLRSKEMATMLNISLATIQKHRESIRRKLILTGKRTNLYTYLQSFADKIDSGQKSWRRRSRRRH